MGGSSVVSDLENYTPAGLIYQGVSKGVQAIGNLFSPPSPPQLQAPNAQSSTPTLAQTNTTSLQNQLNQEKVAASTSTIMTGGAGLLDEPTTTSRVLVGS